MKFFGADAWQWFLPYVLFFFAPLKAILIAIGILVAFDLFTGIRAAKARGEKVSSGGLQRTVSKILMYYIAILLSRMMEVVFLPSIPVAAIASGYIALAEFKSNLENIATVTGVDVWTYLREKYFSKEKKD